MKFILNKDEWFGNIRSDILSGIVVSIALVPEAIGFSILAGVDPMIGIYGSIIIATVISFVGGRPGMISGATGAIAMLVIDLVKDYGIAYMFAAGILAGIIQIIFGWSGISKLMKFIPRSVTLGFVNSLGIIIFISQLDHFHGADILFYILLGVSLIILFILPKYLKSIPAPLIAIIFITFLTISFKFDVKNVGDMGYLSSNLPHFSLPKIPLTFETLKIIFPTSLAIAIVGLLESLLTANIVDNITKTYSSKKRESIGQGVTQIINGFFGGLGGCAMIGQTVINVTSGGRKRLSTFISGVFLAIMLVFLGPLISQIPIVVLVAIMIMVSYGTIDWHSFEYLKRAPKEQSVIMLSVIFSVVITHNLAIGIILGVIMSSLVFMSKNANIYMKEKDGIVTVKGHLFFATIDEFKEKKANIKSENVKVVDLSHLIIHDDDAVKAIIEIRNEIISSGIKVKGFHKNTVKFINSLESYLEKSDH